MATTKTVKRKPKNRRVHGPRVSRDAAVEGSASLDSPTATEEGTSPPPPGSFSGLDSGLLNEDRLGAEEQEFPVSGPEPTGSASDKPVPSETDAFENVLRIMGVNETYIKPITMYCAQENLKDLVRLDKNLWDMGIANIHLRRRTINYWARSMGLAVPQQLTQQFITHDPGSAPDFTRGIVASNQKWFVEDEGTGVPKLRPIRIGETGMTLDEAKLAIKEMRQQGGQGDEAVVEFNEGMQQWVPNQKSLFVKNNMQAAWMTARDYNRQMQEGIVQDPLDIMTEQLTKVEQIKTSLGLKTDQQPKADIVQMVEAMGKLKEITAQPAPQALAQPDWMSDPLLFIQAIRGVMPEAPKGPDPTILEELKNNREEMKANRAELAAFKEQVAQREMDNLKAQNQAILTQLQQVQTELQKPRGEATAMGIMEKGIVVGKEELSGLRKDLKDIAQMAIAGGPPVQSPGARAERVVNMKTALADADRLEQLTDILDLALSGG